MSTLKPHSVLPCSLCNSKYRVDACLERVPMLWTTCSDSVDAAVAAAVCLRCKPDDAKPLIDVLRPMLREQQKAEPLPRPAPRPAPSRNSGMPKPAVGAAQRRPSRNPLPAPGAAPRVRDIPLPAANPSSRRSNPLPAPARTRDAGPTRPAVRASERPKIADTLDSVMERWQAEMARSREAAEAKRLSKAAQHRLESERRRTAEWQARFGATDEDIAQYEGRVVVCDRRKAVADLVVVDPKPPKLVKKTPAQRAKARESRVFSVRAQAAGGRVYSAWSEGERALWQWTDVVTYRVAGYKKRGLQYPTDVALLPGHDSDAGLATELSTLPPKPRQRMTVRRVDGKIVVPTNVLTDMGDCLTAIVAFAMNSGLALSTIVSSNRDESGKTTDDLSLDELWMGVFGDEASAETPAEPPKVADSTDTPEA